MSLHPTMKRRLHERLHPLIGEEEADALLDEVSPQDPVTRQWLRDELERFATKELIEDRFERVDERFELIDQRFERIDERFELIDRRFERVDERFERIDERFERIDERFATKEWLEERFYVKEHLDLKLETTEHRLATAVASSEIRMIERLRQQNLWTMSGIGFITTVLTLAQIIWG